MLSEEMAIKPIHITYTIKTTGRKHHTMYCGKCGVYKQRVCYGDKYCRECGTKIDWSDSD